MNIAIKYYVLILFFAGICLFSACDDNENDVRSPSVFVLVSEDTTLSFNSGFPGNSIAVEGEGLEQIKTILFDGKIPSVFNPALNSEKALFFMVPFSEEKGSRFGMQEITFIKRSGVTFTTPFNLIQPDPIISDFTPERPVVGETATVKGEWFYDVTQVTFGGNPIDFSVLSSGAISVIIPEDVTEGADLEVTTIAGSSTKFMPIDEGFDIYLVTDFDGNGLRPNINWGAYGDYSELNLSDVDGISGNYQELIWAGDNTNTFVGCESSGGDPFFSTLTGADDVFFLIEVNCNGAIGTVVEFLIVDGDGINWSYRHTFAENGWQTIEAPVSAFGYQYDPTNQENGDVNPSEVRQVKVTLAEWSGIVPSVVRFDNVRFHVYE